MAWFKELDDDLHSLHRAMIYADELRATGLFARVTQKGTRVQAWRRQVTDMEDQADG